MKIITYMKPSCGWSNGVRAIMRKYELPFEDRDIINDSEQRVEMFRKTGQMMQPCVEIDGKMLTDVSGEEVETYLLANDFVTAVIAEADAPTNKACDKHANEASISIEPLEHGRARNFV
jgi:glutaredoxin|tara:strand:- start:891 stop:1247 length:357 start_codon:yes stop_codon:yes gene_type:complete